MTEPYELLSNRPGFVGPADTEGPTCDCGNVLAVGDECVPCAGAKCRKNGCEKCQARCEECGNWFCEHELLGGVCDDVLCRGNAKGELPF